MKDNLTLPEFHEEQGLKKINSKQKSLKEVAKSHRFETFKELLKMYLYVFIIPLLVVFIINRVAFASNISYLTQVTTEVMGCIMSLAVIVTRVLALVSLPIAFLDELLQGNRE